MLIICNSRYTRDNNKKLQNSCKKKKYRKKTWSYHTY